MPYREHVVVAKDRMIRDGRWKLVYQPLESGMRLSLYDVQADPGCTVDITSKRPDLVSRLWEELRAWMEADPVVRPHLAVASDDALLPTAHRERLVSN